MAGKIVNLNERRAQMAGGSDDRALLYVVPDEAGGAGWSLLAWSHDGYETLLSGVPKADAVGSACGSVMADDADLIISHDREILP